MAFPGEVGLRVLLSPFSSNVLVRTACCSVGIALPVYSTFKAIEQKDQAEQQRWLLYWAAYGSFSIAEVFSDKILSWFPLYHHMKFAFLVWLQLPASNGAKHLYMRHMRPFLLRHQAQLDQAVEFIYGQMTKIVKSHQGEIQFAKAIFMKILASVSGVVKGFAHPEERQAIRAIEGPAIQTEDSAAPAKQTEDSESDNDN